MKHDEDADENLRALNDASSRLARGDAAAVEPLIAAHVAIGFAEPEARRFCEAPARAVLGGDTSAALEDEIAAAEHAMIMTVEDAGARFELLAEALPRGVAVRRESRQLRRQLATRARAIGCSIVEGQVLKRAKRFYTLAGHVLEAVDAGRSTGVLMDLLEGAFGTLPEGPHRATAAPIFEGLKAQTRGRT